MNALTMKTAATSVNHVMLCKRTQKIPLYFFTNYAEDLSTIYSVFSEGILQDKYPAQ
jgi:hypothetical protein